MMNRVEIDSVMLNNYEIASVMLKLVLSWWTVLKLVLSCGIRLKFFCHVKPCRDWFCTLNHAEIGKLAMSF